jgi:hypothetical protein
MRSKVPQGLLVTNIGGIYAGNAVRKSNFLHVSRRFLSDLGADLGVHGRVEVEAGDRKSSGVARLTSDNLVVELSEPETRDGLRVSCSVHGEATEVCTSMIEPIAPLADANAFEDFLYRVKAMLDQRPTPSSKGGT